MKILVYSAVYGGFDKIQTPSFYHKDVDYHLFTDVRHSASANGWNYVTLDPPGGNARLRARRIKVGMPLLSEAHGYDATVWIDGSHLPKVQLASLVPQWLEGYSFAGWLHHLWQCTYTEIRKCAELKKDNKEKLAIAQREIRASGFPDNYGQMATPIVVRRQSDNAKKHAEMWLDCIENLSIRDQVSYVWCGWKLWKSGMEEWINVLGPNAFNCKQFSWSGGHAR